MLACPGATSVSHLAEDVVPDIIANAYSRLEPKSDEKRWWPQQKPFSARDQSCPTLHHQHREHQVQLGVDLDRTSDGSISDRDDPLYSFRRPSSHPSSSPSSYSTSHPGLAQQFRGRLELSNSSIASIAFPFNYSKHIDICAWTCAAIFGVQRRTKPRFAKLKINAFKSALSKHDAVLISEANGTVSDIVQQHSPCHRLIRSQSKARRSLLLHQPCGL
jgi:hypothetical protein